MLEEAEARQRILDWTPEPVSQSIPLRDACGLRVADSLRAAVALPGFDNSQVDGYALQAASSREPLRVIGEQPAGLDRQLSLGPGEAIRIFTGGPIPRGADAIVMQEDVEIASDGSIRVLDPAEPGDFVRRKGADLCEGQVLLRPGQAITAGTIGLLASQDLDSVPAFPRPRCSLLSTGDELARPGAELKPGQLFDSNGPMLRALVETWGGQAISTRHATDDPAYLKEVLQESLQDTDLCLIAGGVSVGEHDHVKATLEELGVEGGFWKVRIKPGKPLYFGRKERTLVFGLPGNPVSAYITFLLFALPSLRRLLGDSVDPASPALPAWCGRLKEDWENRGNRPHYMRGVWNPENGEVSGSGLQQSHALFSMSRSNCLVRMEAETHLKAGSEVQIWGLSPSESR